jgi:hypothetical protein
MGAVPRGGNMKIHLSDSYRLNNGTVEYFSHYWDDKEKFNPQFEWVPSQYEINKLIMLISRENVSPNVLRAGTGKPVFDIIFDADDGIGGNSNNNIKRYHGWRGTTNDVSVCAHGLRKIIGFKKLKNGQVSIELSKDLKNNED